MKKLLGVLSAALAAGMILATPASAVAILTGDSFSSATKNAAWEIDRYEPDEFDPADGYLYLSLGSKGFTSARPADKKDSYYALQGRRLPVAKPTGNTWTATVKVNLDDKWFGNSNTQRRIEFRVDLVDGKGNALKSSPTLAVVKTTSLPAVNIATSKSKTGWAAVRTYVDGDKDIVSLDIDQGWHTLSINCAKGVISYYLDEKKMGTFPVTQTDVYPAYMAIGAQNYNRPDTFQFDNCYLYNGSVLQRQRTSEAQDKHEENMEEKYEKKRNNWEDKYTEYKFYFHDGKDTDITFNGKTVELKERKAYTQSKLKSLFKISEKDWSDEQDLFRELIAEISGHCDDVEEELTKEIPDSYWDY